jgi:hypothetical protein
MAARGNKPRHRKGAGRTAGGKREAIAELMREVAQYFFRIRPVGQKNRVHHRLGRWCVWLHAQPRAARPSDRPADRWNSSTIRNTGARSWCNLRREVTLATASSTPASWQSQRRWALISAKRTSGRASRSCGGRAMR